jgi:hypothetical protein
MEGTVTIKLSDLDKLREENTKLRSENLYHKNNINYKVLNLVIEKIIKKHLNDSMFIKEIFIDVYKKFNINMSIIETSNGIIVEYNELRENLL